MQNNNYDMSDLLPRVLEVARLASARAPELGAVALALANSGDGAWGDAAVPSHARRRATSHAGRGRRTYRPNADRKEAERAGGGAPLPESRAMRRRAGRLAAAGEAGAAAAAAATTSAAAPPPRRLETHVWHAKRLAMSGRGGEEAPLWGHALATGAVGPGRGDRAVRRRLAKGAAGGGGALVHDASYWAALQVTAPDGAALAAFLDAATGGRAWRAAAGAGGGGGAACPEGDPSPPAALLTPARELDVVLRGAPTPGGPPVGPALGPAAVLALPPEGEGGRRTKCALWVWVHAASLPAARPALASAAAAVPGGGVSLLPDPAPVRRVEVVGRGADAAVWRAVGRCVQGSGGERAFTPAAAARLRDGAVLACILADPRLARPLAEERWAVHVEEEGGEGGRQRRARRGRVAVPGAAMAGGDGPLPWPGAGCLPPLSEVAVSAARAARRAAASAGGAGAPPQPPPSSSSPSTPALLIRRAPGAGLAPGDATRADGGRGGRALPRWSLVLPAGWVHPFWGALLPARPTAPLGGGRGAAAATSAAAAAAARTRPAGQAEWRTAAGVQGAPWFPHDWPDSPAGVEAAAAEAGRAAAAARARPPGRRKGGGGGGAPAWAALAGEAPISSPHAWPPALFVARTRDDLEAARGGGGTGEWRPTCLLPARLTPAGRGVPRPGDAVWIGGALAGFVTTPSPRGGRAGCGAVVLAGALWGCDRLVPPPARGRRRKVSNADARPATAHALVEVRPGDGSGRLSFAAAAAPVHGPAGVAWRDEKKL